RGKHPHVLSDKCPHSAHPILLPSFSWADLVVRFSVIFVFTGSLLTTFLTFPAINPDTFKDLIATILFVVS
ncbi:Hypothetical protein FKW44_021247, partial [Caligus rogercresseyi]